jgi:hypothetical protein
MTVLHLWLMRGQGEWVGMYNCGERMRAALEILSSVWRWTVAR